MYELRRSADYSPERSPVRYVIDEKLKVARTNVLWACREAENQLAKS